MTLSQQNSTKAMSVKLDLGTRNRLEKLAVDLQRSPHWMMREAIAQYVEREERREAFRQSTLAAWIEFQESGLHAEAPEVETWLASWGADGEVPAPVCHE